MPEIGLVEIGYIILGLAIGGILKGATGAGAPVAAVPVIALFTNVPFAVTMFMGPTLFSNMFQIWATRHDRMPVIFVAAFALAGIAGAAIGTYLLARLTSDFLLNAVGTVTLCYVGLRLLRPDWVLQYQWARWLVIPAGLVGGCLQGATGISAPVSITFLNAMKLSKSHFVSTISVFFISMLLAQIPMLANYGFLTWTTAGLSALAAGVLMLFMPIGAWLTKFISNDRFNQLVLGLLTLIALRLLFF